MKNRNLSISLFLLLMVSHPVLLQAQSHEQETRLAPRNIRARKLARNWQGENVLLTLADDRQIRGKFIGSDFYNFTMEIQGTQVTLPIDKVLTVTLKPGPMEVCLALVGGLLGSGLGIGIVSLTAPGTGPDVVATVALLGAGAGLWWGYTTFYQEVVIELVE
ncbi:MAG: hypothetical protein JSU77_01905 [Fidelibacterota bacterium]|nr:MAG: hypothetical protein JSU77_01905 [Candidatus Neomarinimicrobiota bacterium]